MLSIALYIVSALLLGFLIVSIQKYLRIIVNLFLGISIHPKPPNIEVPESERVQFKSRAGLRLSGFVLRGHHGGRPAGTIVFCHEFGSDGTSALLYADFLLEAGYDLFSFDFRGHGLSETEPDYEPRHWATNRETSDILGALAYIRSRKDLRSDQVGLFGISRGGAAALAAAAMDGAVRAVACDSTFSTWATLYEYMRRWVVIYALFPFIYRNLPKFVFTAFGRTAMWLSELRLRVRLVHLEKALREYRGATLFIHGARDTYISATQAKYLSERASRPSSFYVFDKAKHNGARFSDGETYVKLVTEFFDRHLALARPSDVSLRARGS